MSSRWWRPWVPWGILTVAIFAWGTRPVKDTLDRLASPSIPVPGIHERVMRTPPVVRVSKVEKVELKLNVLSATRTGILLAAGLSGLWMGYSTRSLLKIWWETLIAVRQSLLTIAAMLALGNVTKLSGADATLGMTLAKTGVFYPFFGTLLGWLGVALTGSDTASNVLFGSLQRITAEQLGLSPYLDVWGQFDRRGHGQDDRRPEHRGGRCLSAGPWERGEDPAVCLWALAGAGRSN